MNPLVNCEKLELIDVSDNPNFVFEEGVLMDKEKTRLFIETYKSDDYSIPNKVTIISACAFFVVIH